MHASISILGFSIAWLLLAWQQADARPAQDSGQQSTSVPASRPADPTAGLTRPPQADFVRDLIRSAEERPIQPIAPIEPAPGSHTDGSLYADGAVLPDRPGRLERAGDRLRFIFVADASGSSEVAMELNRNQLLELMEREVEKGVTEFIITAEVSRYRGSNYLTLRKVLRRVPNGNVSP